MGKFTWPESAEYEGEVPHGRREGQGTLRFEGSCSSYEGEWRRGLRHGQGGVVFPEHRPSRPATKVSARPPAETNTLASPGKATGYYQGGWEDDLRHGQGTIVYPTGSCYVGEWHSGDKQGQGRMEWADSGQVYEGEWDKGLPTGWGTLVYGAARGGGARAGEGARAGAPPLLRRGSGGLGLGIPGPPGPAQLLRGPVPQRRAPRRGHVLLLHRRALQRGQEGQRQERPRDLHL